MILQFFGARPWQRLLAPGLIFFAGFAAPAPTLAADLGELPYPPPPPAGYAYNGGFFGPLDPRCRIVPMPEANLYGDTVRFRPTAVCQSLGLYADSVLFP